jgi:RNA polymerase-binding transcription factor DksA
MTNDEKFENLLAEFAQHRDAIKAMIADLEKIRETIDKILPEKLDHRYKMLFEERIKTITSFYSSMLDMRKEITKSIKDEIELRRKVRFDEKEVSVEDMLDVSKFADKVFQLSQKRKKLIEDSEYATKQVEIEELGIEMPTGTEGDE